MECAFTYFIILMPTEEKLDASARLSREAEREREMGRGTDRGHRVLSFIFSQDFCIIFGWNFWCCASLRRFCNFRQIALQWGREGVERRGRKAMAYKCRRRVGEQFTRLHLKDMRKTF